MNKKFVGCERMISRLFLFIMMFLGVPFAHASLKWMTDYSQALEKSKKENKPLMLFFTGSDWSGWSMKMKKEILDTPEFEKKISGVFICVQIDFPEHFSLSQEEKKQNLELKKRWDVVEYPRVLLLDSQEREIARLGFPSEKGDKFAEDLLKIVSRDNQLTAVMSKLNSQDFSPKQLQEYYEEAQELQRMGDAEKILEFGLKCSDPLFFLIEKYRLLVEEGKGSSDKAAGLREQILLKDPHNQNGAHFSLALIDFQERASLRGKKDPKAVIQPLEVYLERFGETDLLNRWRIEMMIAQFYLEADECGKALTHAQTAFNTAPVEKKQEIQNSLDYIKTQVR